jgi:hypothetical protein
VIVATSSLFDFMWVATSSLFDFMWVATLDLVLALTHRRL